jgi:3-phosphoshikimate 1-carboxyvinyltransferase
MTARVSRPGRIRAAITVPPDKSISHRALIFNAIADGRALIDDPLDSADVRSTAACLAALGVEIDWPPGGRRVAVRGRGLHGLFESDDVLDCGNSGTTMRLLAGLLSAHPILSVLTGDDSLRSRPMARVIGPLRNMGAHIHARRGDTCAPVVVRGGALRGIAYNSPVASAQVKSAVLLAGLYAEGETAASEPARSRDHTERMLKAMGTSVEMAGTTATIRPATRLQPLSLRVPGDISSAAPWLVLGACHPDAEIVLRGVNLNPTRTGILDILSAMGGDLEVQEERITAGEPIADIVIRTSRLTPTSVTGELVPRGIDELPFVALLGCLAEGETNVRDAAERRVKVSDRVDAVVRVLGRMGAKIRPLPDGFVVSGPQTLQGARIDASGDHRIGMLAAVAGALAEGETRIENGAVDVSYPAFWDELARAAAGPSPSAV